MSFIPNIINYPNIYMYDIYPLICIICGIKVVITKNPIVSVLYLVGLFITFSCYIITLGCTFLGLSYLLVYVGAISILFLFILMLINIRTSELSTENKNSFSLAVVVGILFNYPVNMSLPYNLHTYNNEYISSWIYPDLFQVKSVIYYVSSVIWDKNMCENLHITSIGNILYTDFGILLIINSLILLLAMVGAIVITIK